MLEIEKKESKTLLFRNYSCRLARALSTIRAGRAVAGEEMFIRKLPRTRHIWKSEILVSYLNNPSEETISGSNKIKEQRKTMKLQNEEVTLRNTKNLG